MDCFKYRRFCANLNKTARISVMACICAVLLASCACAAPSGSDKALRVGWYLVPGVQTCDVQSVGAGSRMVYSGYNYEYLQRIAEFTGWKYVFVMSSFKDCCEMLAKGEIDLLGDVARVGDRGSLFIFPDNECGSSGLSLVTLASNDKYDFNGFSGFSGIRIGAVAGSNMVKILPLLSRKKNFTPVVKTFSTNADVRLALKKGEVDAIMVSSLASMKGLRSWRGRNRRSSISLSLLRGRSWRASWTTLFP
jgi:ABC-type amino acid transport substrate-binding protein